MIMKCFNLENIINGKLHTVPFRWGQFSEIWANAEIAANLAAEYPTESFNYRERNGGYFFRRTVIFLANQHPHEPQTLSAAWLDLCSDILSAEFRNAVAKFCATDLTNFKMEAVVFRGMQATRYLPHTDASLTYGYRLIIYFNPVWEKGWGGAFQILNPEDHSDVVAETLPLIGNANLIIREIFQDTWHGVTRLSENALTTRNVLIITFYEPSVTSTRQ